MVMRPKLNKDLWFHIMDYLRYEDLLKLQYINCPYVNTYVARLGNLN